MKVDSVEATLLSAVLPVKMTGESVVAGRPQIGLPSLGTSCQQEKHWAPVIRNETVNILRFLPFVVLLLTQLLAEPSQAGGLFHRLPRDGTWVEYELVELPYIVRIASVGTTIHNSSECRWIEIKLSGGEGRSKINIISKLLIPIAHLKPGVQPQRHLVKGWIAEADFVIAVRSPKELQALEAQLAIPFVSLFLPPPLENAKDLEPKFVESKLGRLSCKGVVGTTRLTIGGLGGDFNVTYRMRLHARAPFGVVSARIETSERIGKAGVVEKLQLPITLNFKLKAFGEDAESEIPKRK